MRNYVCIYLHLLRSQSICICRISRLRQAQDLRLNNVRCPLEAVSWSKCWWSWWWNHWFVGKYFVLSMTNNNQIILISVNSVCWAPHDFGLMLACGSSDGSISIISSTGDGTWDTKKIPNAHTVGYVVQLVLGHTCTIKPTKYSGSCNLRPLYLAIPCILRPDISGTICIFSV